MYTTVHNTLRQIRSTLSERHSRYVSARVKLRRTTTVNPVKYGAILESDLPHRDSVTDLDSKSSGSSSAILEMLKQRANHGNQIRSFELRLLHLVHN